MSIVLEAILLTCGGIGLLGSLVILGMTVFMDGETDEKIALVLVCISVIMLLSGIFLGDKADIINTEQLGERMCEEHNLEYSYRDFKNGNELVIHCMNSSQSVEDGYLVMN